MLRATKKTELPADLQNLDAVKILSIEQLAPLLQREVRTLKADVSRRPDSLPPRLRIPLSNKLLWLEADVLAWLNSCRESQMKK